MNMERSRVTIAFPTTVAMILAGGRTDELSVLTLQRPKAALPYGGAYRIIDFALSNLMHASIANVGILSQYRPESLIDHVGTGASWDFVGSNRGAKILPPFHGADATDWYRGNADAVAQNLNYIHDHAAKLVLILSGDHIYRMDYRHLIAFHLERQADVTVAFKRMGEMLDRRFGCALLDSDGRVVAYEEKPEVPPSDLASLTIYVFTREALEAVLADVHDLASAEFGRDVIPRMVRNGYQVFGYVFDSYWAYTRTVEAYFDAHRDLLSGRVDLAKWQIRTNNDDNTLAGQPPATFRQHAAVKNSLVSDGCIIEGEVRGSVLSPGVIVERGARIEDSILFNNVVVGKGARIVRTIVDKHVAIGQHALVGTAGDTKEAGETAKTGGDLGDHEIRSITLVGKEAGVGARAHVPAGSVVAPDQEVTAGVPLERANSSGAPRGGAVGGNAARRSATRGRS
jgi:glucose-1-phosphate adenylyltransferase